MIFDLVVPGAISGLITAVALLLPTIAIALVYQHGRYVPIWLPDFGLVGAYLTHCLWTKTMLDGVTSTCISIAICGVIALLLHKFLFLPFIRKEDLLPPLLIGVGLSQVFQACAGLYGEGMSQHYPENMLENQFYWEAVGLSVYWADIAFIVLTCLALSGLYWFLKHTHLGLQTRAVISNPDFAATLCLPVQKVTTIVLSSAVLLMIVGTVLRGVRYDLQPSMMLYPGLTALAACIVASPGNRALALLVVVLMEILTSLAGLHSATAPFQRAIPFLVLLVYLVGLAVKPRIQMSLKGTA